MKSRQMLAGLRPLRWFAALRWRHRLLAAALAGAMSGPAYVVWVREREARREQWVAEARRRFDRAVAQHNAQAAEALLAQLSDLTGHDAAVETRLAALRRGDAQPGDAAVAHLLVGEHLHHGRWPEAAREAEKVVTAAPGDMLARAVLARRAFAAGRRDEAFAHLAAIPSPHDCPDSASPAALALAVGIKRELGQDDSDFVSFIAVQLTPLLKSRQVDMLPPAAKLQLIECYHLACDSLEQWPELAECWVPAARLLSQIGDDVEIVAAVALARERHLGVIYRLRSTNRVADAAVKEMIGEFEAQAADGWSAARARSPLDPRPYAGLALAAQRRGERAEAVRWLDRGAKACAGSRDLYLMLGEMLQPTDPATGAVYLERAYEQYPHDPAVQQMLAQLAATAGRPDRAREVCRAARATRPNLAWACRLEAAICLDAGHPTQALEALAPLRPTLAGDAAGMELYVRAACAVGVEVEDLLRTGDDTGAEGSVGAARGFLMAGRPADAVRLASGIIRRFPNHAAARAVRAEGLWRLARTGDEERLPTEPVREAIEAFDWIRRRDPSNRVAAQRVAWLQLRGLESPVLALRAAAPLREERAAAHLTPEMSETLGAVLLANAQPEAALAALNAAVQRAPNRSGAYVCRAEAQARLGRAKAARADLARAASLPQSPREIADWRRVSAQLEGK